MKRPIIKTDYATALVRTRRIRTVDTPAARPRAHKTSNVGKWAVGILRESRRPAVKEDDVTRARGYVRVYNSTVSACAGTLVYVRAETYNAGK